MQGDSNRDICKELLSMYSVDPWKNGYDDTDASSYKYDMKDVEGTV